MRRTFSRLLHLRLKSDIYTLILLDHCNILQK